jgi:metal-responsive CopG/Arc/MetJ family transcriptional regulator
MLTLDENLLEDIDDYRYKNRIPSRSEAIRQLIKKSLSKKKGNKNQLNFF